MSEELDRSIYFAMGELKEAVDLFEKRTRFPLSGYTVKQPYAKGIRKNMLHIHTKLMEELREIAKTLEPDPPEETS